MDITKTSPFTGLTHTRSINVTDDQLDRWQQGALIQDVMPNLSPDEREFIMTGITPNEWDEEFGKPPEDDSTGLTGVIDRFTHDLRAAVADTSAMFIVLHLPTMVRLAAFSSYDNAEAYRRDLDTQVNSQMADDCLIEAVGEDEDLFHTLNR